MQVKTVAATANSDEELMTKVKEHVKADHKEIELTPENIENIQSLVKDV